MDILEAQRVAVSSAIIDPDFIVFNDSWSQIINLQYDPDGSVYMIDWYDRNQCHNTDPTPTTAPTAASSRSSMATRNGRRWICKRKRTPSWSCCKRIRTFGMSRHARRILQERAMKRPLAADAEKLLLLFLNPDEQTSK